MKLSIVLIATLFLFQSCLPEAKNKSLTYQNINIISDLSDLVNLVNILDLLNDDIN